MRLDGHNWPAAILLSSILGLLVSSGGRAQISPGELSHAHADLEGSGHCLRCHEAGKGVASDRCLDCHRLLGTRIAAGAGLHAAPEYRQCERCHVEHHGRDFELVWWGEAGERGFDHQSAGYVLSGAHSRLGCRDCHKRALITAGEVLSDQGKDLSRTFLGLETESCLSCHQDLHRAQFPAQSCQSCHSLERWKPVDGFDHDRAKFVLSGRHVQVACVECHAPGVARGADISVSQLRFTGLAYEECTDCHVDAHAGRLGAGCPACHTAVSWKEVDRKRVDHDRTRFALAGGHRTVACDKCHRPGEGMRIARFGECTDCHRDTHLGQLSNPADGRGCESCHTVESFTPVVYPVERHQDSDFPLAGGHLAVPCNSCHRRVPAAMVTRDGQRNRRQRTESESGEVTLFRFSSQTCVDCHLDPHAVPGQSIASEQRPCEGCHVADAWSVVSFDHGTTEFRLAGRHSAVSCRGCHGLPGEPEDDQPVRFASGSAACEDCHRDSHLGQFQGGETGTLCDRCHSAEGWRELLFDHDRDSSYRLEGAHSRVACAGCHLSKLRDGQTYVQYKRIPTICKDCHAAGVQALSLTGGKAGGSL